MIFSENRYPLFAIMLWVHDAEGGSSAGLSPHLCAKPTSIVSPPDSWLESIRV